MFTEDKSQIPEELQQTSHKETQETTSEPYQEKLLKESEEEPVEIESEITGCDGSDSHKWNNKMEVQRLFSGKPDLEIVEKRTVLFVDDEEKMLRSIERCLQDEPYKRLFAKSGQEALEILQKQEVHVIVTDMLMPDINGIEFFEIVKKMYPRIVKMILSGYVSQDIVLKAINKADVVKFIPKAWNDKDNFKKTILEAIDRYNLQSECNTIGQ